MSRIALWRSWYERADRAVSHGDGRAERWLTFAVCARTQVASIRDAEDMAILAAEGLNVFTFSPAGENHLPVCYCVPAFHRLAPRIALSLLQACCFLREALGSAGAQAPHGVRMKLYS